MNGFTFSIGWHLAELIFGIACYEVVRYLVINKIVSWFKRNKK